MRPAASSAFAAVLLLTAAAGGGRPLTAQTAAPTDPADAAAATAGRSLLLPGWGQWHVGQRRGWAYLALEAGLWITHYELRASGRGYRNQYRDVAWSSGRIQTGARVEGPWAYYEAMTEWTRSGAFDADPTRPGVQPEEDASTFNGAKWALARGLFPSPGGTPSDTDPAYQQALAYYQQHAWGSAYLWDWTGKDAALSRYRDLIHRSDRRFRQASAALGAVLANHVLSAVDAYVSSRGGPETALRVAPEPLPGGTRWTFSARLGGRR